MKSIYHEEAYNEIISRLNKLTPNSRRLWGKMNVAQMMAHCNGPIKVGLADKPAPRMLMGRLMGWMMKSKLYNDSAWSKNLPTSPDFKITNERDFNEEKTNLLSLINAFHKDGPLKAGRFPHPFFGTFTNEQWGKSIYKHLDHHLKQFGV